MLRTIAILGQFMAIQQAAAEALRHPEIGDQVREKYRRRLKKLVDALNQVGFKAAMPKGTYFLYTKAPKGCTGQTFANAEEASQFLITEQSVCCVPWDDAGAFLRFSVTYIAKDEAEEDALMKETVDRHGKIETSVLMKKEPGLIKGPALIVLASYYLSRSLITLSTALAQIS